MLHSCLALITLACLLIIDVQSSHAQWSIPSDTTTIYLRNESGVVIGGRRPPDSLMVPGVLLLRFKQGKVDYDILNETFDWWQTRMSAGSKGKQKQVVDPPGFHPDLRRYLLTERFYLDSSNNIVMSHGLKTVLMSMGGKYLRRLTAASPADSLSITRRGDTIGCDHYNWFVLHTDSSVSPLIMTFALMQYHRNDIILAHPNYRAGKFLANPSDTKFGCENKDTMIRLTRAWDFETGIPEIRVGIYDDGLDWRNPDLGASRGPGRKVEFGWNYILQTDSIEAIAPHGTNVGGIIGAFTNNVLPIFGLQHVAGIAGGWAASQQDTFAGRPTRGSTLAVFGTQRNIDILTFIPAVFEASARSPASKYGLGVHVINSSVTVFRSDLSPGTVEPCTAAINFAFENGVVVVAARDNAANTSRDYPACVEEPWIINVSGSISDKTKTPPSSFGYTIDLLAPSGDATFGCDAVPTLHWTTDTLPNTSLEGPFTGFAGNSAACATVSGSAALILSHFHRNQSKLVKLEPEDVAGILKASSWRGDPDRDTSCRDCWRPLSGWGHLEIGNAFEMLDSNSGKYEVRHYHVSDSLDEPGGWSDWSFTLFDVNWGYPNPLLDLTKFKMREYLVGQNYYESRHRIWTKTVTLPRIWDVNKTSPLFAWGRSGGLNEKSGWSFAQQNLQTGWSQVISSAGGDSLNEGIFHSHNDSAFTVQTVQYEIKLNDSTFLKVPSDSMMGMNFSVFGKIKEEPAGIVWREDSRESDIRIVQHSAGIQCHVYMRSARVRYLDIFDILGRSVTSVQLPEGVSGWTKIDLPINSWTSGSYFAVLRGHGELGTANFIVRK